jgi:hypothetical protein
MNAIARHVCRALISYKNRDMPIKSRTIRKVSAVAVVVVVFYSAAVAGFYWVMRQPPDQFGRIMAKLPRPLMVIFPFRPLWNAARGGELQPGDPAPDFSLPLRGGGSVVRLSDFQGKKPVALIFGSYT